MSMYTRTHECTCVYKHTHTHTEAEGSWCSVAKCRKEDKITTLQKRVSHMMMWVTPSTHDILGKA